MGLLERLIGLELPKIPAHQFTAALGEGERGKTTRAEIITFFGIQPAEEADLDAIIAKIIPIPDSYSLGATVVLTNVGAAYDTIDAARGLGFVRLEGAGISGVEFTVRYNKIGTGTLSWQLWDDTTAAEVGVIDDAAAAGNNKQSQVSIIPGSPLAPGLHTLRVRCKSTVAADDPVYYGATLRVRRVNVLWSKILEEVLVLAEKGYPTVADAAEIRTRLGI
jgi:hypothetical protein